MTIDSYAANEFYFLCLYLTTSFSFFIGNEVMYFSDCPLNYSTSSSIMKWWSQLDAHVFSDVPGNFVVFIELLLYLPSVTCDTTGKVAQ